MTLNALVVGVMIEQMADPEPWWFEDPPISLWSCYKQDLILNCCSFTWRDCLNVRVTQCELRLRHVTQIQMYAVDTYEKEK